MKKQQKKEPMFAEAAEKWLAEKEQEGKWSLTTRKKYEAVVYGSLAKHFAQIPLSGLTGERIREFVTERMEKRSRLKLEMLLLGKILDDAVKHGWMERNPCGDVAVPGRRRREIRILRDEEILALEKMAGEYRYGQLILFILYMGLRVGEALGLTWDKVNLETGRVQIARQMVTYYDRIEGKTARKLVPYTKNRLVRDLRLTELSAEILRRRKEAAGGDGLVFTAPDGRPVCYADVYYEFHGMMKRIGREDMTIHGLRHTAATSILYETRDWKILRDFLGHRSLGTTTGYPRASEHALREFVRSLNEKYTGNSPKEAPCSRRSS